MLDSRSCTIAFSYELEHGVSELGFAIKVFPKFSRDCGDICFQIDLVEIIPMYNHQLSDVLS